jgi:TPR repeat protein
VPKDAARAFALFQEPAIAGMARAQNNLGLLYVRGEGVEQDYERAAQMFQFAAEQGLHAAMTNLGVMYENGFGVPVDEVRAHELYKMGGRKEVGHEVTLQFPLYEPRLLPLNPSEGVPEALRKRAGLGDPLAQFQMAWLLLQDPQITRQDMALAVQSMQAAAQAGIIAAQANLGWMYFEGTGLPQDYVLGHMWLLLASASGEEQLQTLSAQLSRNLLPMQIQEAQERAARRLQSMRE